MSLASAPRSAAFGNGAVSHWYRAPGPPSPGDPLPGPRTADVCLVGAGYTGLWTAYYLKRAQPDLRIVVLEKEFAGFGASGRNGGWVVGEIAGSRERYARRHGRQAAVELQRAMFATVDEILRVAKDEGIDADLVKGGVLNTARNPAQAARARAMVEANRAWGWEPDDIVLLSGREADERIGIEGQLAATFSPHCARVQPAKLVRGLAATVRALGVEVYENTPVLRVVPRRDGRPAAAVTPHGTVTAEYVVRATEGFTARLAGHRRDWLPMNSSMIVTTPLPDAAWDAIGWRHGEVLGDLAHYYMYAQRTADGRIAFGGRGRPYRYGSGVDDAGVTQPSTVDQLWRMLVGMFPAVAGSASVDHAWSGVLGVPRDWCATAVLDHRTGLGHAGGYTGHGVATTNLAGRTLRDLVLRRDTELTALPWVNWRVRRWEPEPLRWLGVQSMYALYQVADGREASSRAARTSVVARLADTITGH
ncbi:NAD(P)/FAD-dependent oxidoreductase [Actinomadura rupiterrae]|uniref:NAD(P)/FAD-dependent oxidoreductase n=1 Tax=Actinomadura rupiterrae TaxID=559627 RepID=UPI0020A25BBD|nr:FAD-binding oxidoreductase [Actinomadura rupiterrae]MCP2341214.1 glycine/D-amino acid oxidase-like deaminating enzyme [Actinomadura rupiterrae]